VLRPDQPTGGIRVLLSSCRSQDRRRAPIPEKKTDFSRSMKSARSARVDLRARAGKKSRGMLAECPARSAELRLREKKFLHFWENSERVLFKLSPVYPYRVLCIDFHSVRVCIRIMGDSTRITSSKHEEYSAQGRKARPTADTVDVKELAGPPRRTSLTSRLQGAGKTQKSFGTLRKRPE